MSRFDYVMYDKKAAEIQEHFKSAVSDMEKNFSYFLGEGRAKSLAVTKLEECYMWIGKQIRDDQIKRNGPAPLQEERKNS